MPVLPLLVSLLSAVISLTALVWNIVSKSRDHTTAFQGSLAKLDERCTLLELKIGVFWRLAEENLAQFLKKPTHLEMDTLLDKLRDHTLTLDECYALRSWLSRVYLGPDASATRQERLIAVVVSAAVESLILELERPTSS